MKSDLLHEMLKKNLLNKKEEEKDRKFELSIIKENNTNFKI